MRSRANGQSTLESHDTPAKGGGFPNSASHQGGGRNYADKPDGSSNCGMAGVWITKGAKKEKSVCNILKSPA